MKTQRPYRWKATVDAPKATILLAEDDSAFRALLAGVLRDDGYEVIEARNGGEVVDYVSFSLLQPGLCERADLVITDINMPGLSGLDVMATLEHTRCLPKTIVITAFGSAEVHERAKALGALAVLDKPFDLDELRQEVARRIRKVA
jgi:two-component system response regulator (stage 0 sporulation protein F)